MLGNYEGGLNANLRSLGRAGSSQLKELIYTHAHVYFSCFVVQFHSIVQKRAEIPVNSAAVAAVPAVPSIYSSSLSACHGTPHIESEISDRVALIRTGGCLGF